MFVSYSPMHNFMKLWADTPAEVEHLNDLKDWGGLFQVAKTVQVSEGKHGLLFYHTSIQAQIDERLKAIARQIIKEVPA